MERLRQRLEATRLARLLRASKWVAAGALIFDPDGRVLLVKDRFRNAWEYPAGSSIGDESPLDTCRREIAEEVGLKIKLADYQLLGVDFFRRRTYHGNLFFTFTAAVTADQAAKLKLQAIEIADARWATREEAIKLISPRLRGRFTELLAAHDAQRPVYLQAGKTL